MNRRIRTAAKLESSRKIFPRTIYMLQALGPIYLTQLSIRDTHNLLDPICSQTSRSYILTELSIRYTHRTVDLYTHRTLTELSVLCTRRTLGPIYSQNHSRPEALPQLSIRYFRYTHRALDAIHSKSSSSRYTHSILDLYNSRFYRLTDFGSNIVTELDAAHSTHANQATNQPDAK